MKYNTFFEFTESVSCKGHVTKGLFLSHRLCGSLSLDSSTGSFELQDKRIVDTWIFQVPRGIDINSSEKSQTDKGWTMGDFGFRTRNVGLICDDATVLREGAMETFASEG